MATEFIAPSGKKVVINAAPWKDAKLLKAAMMDAAAKADIKVDLDGDISTLVKALLLVDSSGIVDAAMDPCLQRCTRDGEAIKETTFDDAEARKDYYPIVIACAQENLGPLVAGLLSALPAGLLSKLQSAKNPA